MALLKDWYTVQELAGLPGMPTTERGVQKWAKKNLDGSRLKARGKGLEYALKSLPLETQTHLKQAALTAAFACVPDIANSIANKVANKVAPPSATKDIATSADKTCATATKDSKAIDTAGSLTEGVQQASSTLPPSAYQTNTQRAVGDARQSVLRAVKRLQQDAGVTPRAAMLSFLTQAAAGRLTGDVASAMLTLARDTRGRKAARVAGQGAHGSAHPCGLPSLRTLQNWLERAEKERPGDNLAPVLRQPDMELAPWMVLAVDLKRRPQKPTTTQVYEQMRAAWPDYSHTWVKRHGRGQALATPEQIASMAAHLVFPSADQVYRFFREKFNHLDLLDGQHLGSALRAHKFYQQRSNAGLEPFCEVHADGWNTHFLAPCAVTGNYISYEVWHFHDVATRYTTPFSIGVSESADVILKGLEQCIRVGGIPAIWQTDSTGSVKNAKVQFDPVASLSARAGMTVVHPQTVGNSQANGIAENYNTRLDRESRALATYMHPERMDSLAFKQVRKFTGQMVKALEKGDVDAHKAARAAALRVGKGILFESREQMVAWLDEVRVKSNNTPHSALKKVRDASGKLRHQTPQEALNEAIAGGWLPVALDESSLVELFHEHVRRTVQRQCVTAFMKQRYFHDSLGGYNGKEVLVSFDVMDGEHVWVKTTDGRLICEAKYVSDTGYHSTSMYEYALAKRMDAQIKRKENQIEAIKDRMDPDRAPLDVRAIDISNAVVLPITGLDAAQHSHASALTALTQAHANATELTPKTPEPSTDFALQMFGDQVRAEDKARASQAAQTQADAEDIYAATARVQARLAEQAAQAQAQQQQQRREEADLKAYAARMAAVMDEMIEEQRQAAM